MVLRGEKWLLHGEEYDDGGGSMVLLGRMHIRDALGRMHKRVFASCYTGDVCMYMVV